ncbi:3'-5' exonuclease [Rhodobacter capsulatus]|jgi:DNA polymerase III epsilon subunit-like protein|uniref:Exonuclease family protein n=1 Tax=Rhodobacter capsulatus (strain ATCC BAA-309 / NBRC 16581 / SB1003) TaxID=272942 RepID=D5ASE4_RHOCB|nr:exonuclease [Rhodobacter capsulatus]ADE85035.1 exonuclease family protein [Rhodobacter capsulatus SB 1003]ETD02069.1 hypothetical protein U714_07625 [Rhodobacter capsulatus DE442]ETD77743.1 hypothetical protein U717_07800 [Rhodobacter capsulatus R121]ETE54101.1 hypothetical protein U715_07795 [Rhodobacter capsulatus Y262]MDS0926689.1 hypothetical protein [Rhodobacter capsulatus]
MTPIFIDIEASSLTGWPIEIGLSRLSSLGIETWSCLIHPRPGWSEADWDPRSAEIHGIAREQLHTAPAAEIVAEAVEARLGAHVLSDCPEFDGKWLTMLLRRPVQLLHFDDAVSDTFGAEALGRAQDLLATLPHPHRAGPDAEAMAQVWLELTQGR